MFTKAGWFKYYLLCTDQYQAVLKTGFINPPVFFLNQFNVNIKNSHIQGIRVEQGFG
uniref:Uncharacterized protein n=1 Tax=Anguilla anguilla TaxID=7936 RepID=A0A0E9PIG5_ANGAN